jgi:hypothetical protein
LSADQGFAEAQFKYGALLTASDDFHDHLMAARFLEMAADQGLKAAQVFYGDLLRRGNMICFNQASSAQYYKLAADQWDPDGSLKYANCLLYGDGVEMNKEVAELYFQFAASEGNLNGQMQYRIALLSGLLGRFDFEAASRQFRAASSSNQFARMLVEELADSEEESLLSLESFEIFPNYFTFLQSDSDQRIPLIQILNSHLNVGSIDPVRVIAVWKETAQVVLQYMCDFSRKDWEELQSLPMDLASCASIESMICIILKMYSIESSLYKNMNCFLRRFPQRLVPTFMKELRGLLSYIYLLQSSIAYCSRMQPLGEGVIVYRGISSKGSELCPLYESMIGNIIDWPSFTSTSLDVKSVIRRFGKKGDGILFEINCGK